MHERTVQRVARGEVAPAPRRHLRAVESRPRTSQVTIEQVDERIMAAAKQLVEQGTYSRVEVVDATTVLVR